VNQAQSRYPNAGNETISNVVSLQIAAAKDIRPRMIAAAAMEVTDKRDSPLISMMQDWDVGFCERLRD
jgi:hypothetical protein